MMAITAAPPKALTMEEYRSRWQPQGWELITIGPNMEIAPRVLLALEKCIKIPG